MPFSLAIPTALWCLVGDIEHVPADLESEMEGITGTERVPY
jgi:hypothetical protein